MMEWVLIPFATICAFGLPIVLTALMVKSEKSV